MGSIAQQDGEDPFFVGFAISGSFDRPHDLHFTQHLLNIRHVQLTYQNVICSLPK
jgi:hypothetical protein